MPSRQVEVNLISARDLKRGKLFGTQSPAALISVSGSSQRQSSRPCIKGNTDPVWNEQFIFTVDEGVLLGHNPTVKVDIFSSSNFHDSPLGTAYVPLMSAVNKTGELQPGGYSLRRPSGRIQGYAQISVKVLGPKFSSEQLESAKHANAPPQQPPPQYGMPNYGAPPAQYPQYGSAYGYPQGPPPPQQYYQPGYGHQPQVVYVQRNGYGSRYGSGYGGGGGYGGGSRFGGGGGGGMGGAGMGMGAGLLMGGLGGLALGEALDNDGGGCGGGGCGGGGCGGGGCGG